MRTRGEQTASAMENQLSALEQKIDDLLATAESQSVSNEGAPKIDQVADKSSMINEK